MAWRPKRVAIGTLQAHLSEDHRTITIQRNESGVVKFKEVMPVSTFLAGLRELFDEPTDPGPVRDDDPVHDQAPEDIPTTKGSADEEEEEAESGAAP